jgi:TctA family transporter
MGAGDLASSEDQGRIGLRFLIVAGVGEAMASVFDVTHETGHGVAGLLGVLGFPVAALLLSVALGQEASWRVAKKALLWVAHVN